MLTRPGFSASGPKVPERERDALAPRPPAHPQNCQLAGAGWGWGGGSGREPWGWDGRMGLAVERGVGRIYPAAAGRRQEGPSLRRMKIIVGVVAVALPKWRPRNTKTFLLFALLQVPSNFKQAGRQAGRQSSNQALTFTHTHTHTH